MHLAQTFFSHFLLTDPCSVEVDGDERRRNGEVVHEAVQLQHEPELVRRGNELKMYTCTELNHNCITLSVKK